jgi:hypothetical protein
MFKWILKPESFDYQIFNLNWVLAFKNKNIFNKLKKIDVLKEKIRELLSKNYNEKVAEVYFKKLSN